MKKKSIILIWTALLLITTIPVFAEDSDLAVRINEIMSKCPEHDNYHVPAWQVNKWMKTGRTDFLVVDIRLAPDDGPWGQPQYGRIPGSIYIPYTELFKPENLNKLPKDKKIILVSHMGVHENYSVVPLRLIGYDAYSMLLGMSGWQKDYPATGHIKSLLNDADTQDFPLAKEAEGHMMRHGHKGHKE
ncbi:MAG: rhodanese-like domain-containing protein [Nitrospirae bacterium]|nr:rhodanese-like domain-containing protein [Nitrospirota bacterium]